MFPGIAELFISPTQGSACSCTAVLLQSHRRRLIKGDKVHIGRLRLESSREHIESYKARGTRNSICSRRVSSTLWRIEKREKNTIYRGHQRSRRLCGRIWEKCSLVAHHVLLDHSRVSPSRSFELRNLRADRLNFRLDLLQSCHGDCLIAVHNKTTAATRTLLCASHVLSTTHHPPRRTKNHGASTIWFPRRHNTGGSDDSSPPQPSTPHIAKHPPAKTRDITTMANIKAPGAPAPGTFLFTSEVRPVAIAPSCVAGVEPIFVDVVNHGPPTSKLLSCFGHASCGIRGAWRAYYLVCPPN